MPRNIIEGQLARARQELTDEMRRLLGRAHRPRPAPLVGGIPGGQRVHHFYHRHLRQHAALAWGLVMQKIRETLDVYPKVKGIQVMNDMGSYMFSQYQGRWIPDSPGRRGPLFPV